MADPTNPYDPAATGGSTLGDILAGAGGNPVNRPQIGAFIQNGQALAGLRTAQTEDALMKAQKAREEAQANDEAEATLAAIAGPDGKPVFTPSQAHAVAVLHRAGGGNFEQLIAGLRGGQGLVNDQTLSDPNQLGTPAQTAAYQGVAHKLAEPVNVPGQYALPAGVPNPVIHQTPASIAQENQRTSAAANSDAHAAAAGQSQAKLAHGFRWKTDETGAVVLDPDGTPQQEPDPAAGSNAVGRRYSQAVLNAGTGIANEVTNIKALATRDGELPDRGLTQFGGAHPGIMATTTNNLGQALSSNTQQHYAITAGNLARFVQTMENAGMRPNQQTIDAMGNIINSPGTTQSQRMYNMGIIRQAMDQTQIAMNANPDATPSQRAEFRRQVATVRQLVPYLPNDVADFEHEGHSGETFGQYLQRTGKGKTSNVSTPNQPLAPGAQTPVAPPQTLDLAAAAAAELAKRQGGAQ